jgi:nicotinamidase/pyrazinamidase
LLDPFVQKNITDVYIAGLAFDYCVGRTALHAIRDKFNVFVIADASRAITSGPFALRCCAYP